MSPPFKIILDISIICIMIILLFDIVIIKEIIVLKAEPGSNINSFMSRLPSSTLNMSQLVLLLTLPLLIPLITSFFLQIYHLSDIREIEEKITWKDKRYYNRKRRRINNKWNIWIRIETS